MMESTLVPDGKNNDNPLFGDDDDDRGGGLFGSSKNDDGGGPFAGSSSSSAVGRGRGRDDGGDPLLGPDVVASNEDVGIGGDVVGGMVGTRMSSSSSSSSSGGVELMESLPIGAGGTGGAMGGDNGNGNGGTAASPRRAPPMSSSSKLSASGLLERSVISSSGGEGGGGEGGGGGLFDDDDGGRGGGLFDDDDGGRGGGLFDGIGDGDPLFDDDVHRDMMQELNLNDAEDVGEGVGSSGVDSSGDYNYGGGMGMGMGMGEIPLSAHAASASVPHPAHPSPAAPIDDWHNQQQQQQQQYREYPYRPPPPTQSHQHQYHHHQQQHHQQQHQQYHQQHQPQQQQQGIMNAMAGSYYYSTTGAGQMTQQGGGGPNSRRVAANGVSAHTIPQQPSVLAGMHVGHDVNLGGVMPIALTTTTTTITTPPYSGGPISSSSSSRYGGGGGTTNNNYGNGNNYFPPPPGAIADYVPPPPFEPHYGKVVVSDPMLIQGTGLFAGPPHWTYLVTVHSRSARGNATTTSAGVVPATANNNDNAQQHQRPQEQPVSAVRRRFRHFVALEDRLRQSVPGAILPPRPEKHPGRAIEEAAARQSSDFAQQRARELGAYMNALVDHPHAGSSPELKLFLLLQDHIGTAWPEVSSSAFTRMTAVGTATVERLTETVDGVLSEFGTAQQVAAGEDSAEILALAAYEGRRIGAVSSSVPKVEGAVSLVRDRGDRLGATGLEMSKLAKDVGWCDRDLATPMEVLSGALLRCGRRTKRLGLELGAAITPFVVQYRTCRYEQMAFADRRSCLKRRTEARSKADGRAARLMMNQTSMQSVGRLGSLERMETEAAMYDELAMEASREADEVATRLQTEVGRISSIRVREWDASMKVIASGMKEACAENASIWESALEAFRREFPDYPVIR